MRIYHECLDCWTVLDDNGRHEWTVSAPDKNGKRTVINRATGRLAGTYASQGIIAEVEKRRAAFGDLDWSTAHL